MQRLFNYSNIARLALFAIGYGLTGALVGGTLNRVMVVDIGLRQSLVGLFFAVPILIAPVRAWTGYISDGYPIMGLRRVPYMIGGTFIAGLGLVIAMLLVTSLEPSSGLLTIGVLLAFVVHEFGRNLGHNTYQALLADKFDGPARARAITAYEVFTILGLTAGAGGISATLEAYDAGLLISVTLGVSVITFMLTLVAALGNEPRHADLVEQTTTARKTGFRQAVRELALADRQVRLFFVIIVLAVIGTLAQDVLLEPYGGKVLGMDVAETTRLTAFWGLGVMASMLLAGLLLIRYFGYMTILRAGLLATVVVFSGVIAAGASGSVDLFRGLVLFMGLGTGLAGASLLAGIISFTTRVRAGLLMGLWGMAMIFGRALGGLAGGIIVDVVGVFGGSDLLAYASVFAIEAALLVVALALTLRLHVDEAAASDEERRAMRIGAIGGAAAVGD